jgi:two-component system sensor histidine kinase GlrK
MNLDDLNQLIDSIIRRDARIIKLTEEALDDLYSMTAAEDKYLISGDHDYDRQFKQIRSDFTERMNELEKIADTEAKTGLLADIKNSKGRYDALLDRRESITADQEVRGKNQQTYMTDREQITRNIDQKLRSLVRVSVEDRDSKLQQSKDMPTQISNIISATEVLAIILVIIITFINARKISLPIKLLGEKTEELAGGTFSDPLKIASPPEIKELADAFNMMCERLKELEQMRIDYISHLSHELRTPLTVIKEASSMLQEGIFSKVPEKQEELFVLIKAECERLISSVNRILDFSLMEAGSMLFSFQNGDIRPIIGKSVSKLSPLTRKKKIDITLDIPQDIPFLQIDVERIEQVFENLLGNALKYTQEGGKIIISTKINSENQTIEVSVSDNGRGIPEDGLVQVFDKFKRVDDGRGAVMGTGLGLSIVRHIINAHGGHVWVKSKNGEGSTFTFSLPVSL